MHWDLKNKNWITTIGAATLVFFAPLLLLWPYTIPVNGRYLGIGNDFRGLYYGFKFYLLDHLSHFTMPLWSPSEGAGFPFYSDPFKQTFYPLNVPLAALYRLLGGYSLLDYQVYTVLAISLFALGLFLWLRSLDIELRAALFSALVIPFSYKLVELIRFPNAIHSAIWYPWILLAITGILKSSSLRRMGAYALLLAFSVLSLLTAGYPYYIYYALFLVGPYFLIFVFLVLRLRLTPVVEVRWKRALPFLLSAGLLPLAACLPYLYKVSTLLQQTTDRAGGNFEYATGWCIFTWQDTLGSLFFPPGAQVEGWYYFGMAGVFLLLLWFVLPFPATSVTGRRFDGWWVKGFFLVWFALISYITYGRDSYLFILLYKIMPFFSSLRCWGRMNIILLPLLAWMLALAYTRFAAQRTRSKIWLVALFGAVVMGGQIYAAANRLYDEYWLIYAAGGVYNGAHYLTSLLGLPAPDGEALAVSVPWVYAAASLLAGGLLVGLWWWMTRPTRPMRQNLLLAALVLFSWLDCSLVGPWAWARRSDEAKPRLTLDIQKNRVNRTSFRVPRSDVIAVTIAHGAGFNVGLVQNWFFERYNQFRLKSENELDARRQLLGVVDGRKLYFSEKIDHPTITAYLQDAQRFSGFETVDSYSGDVLALDITAPVDGYLSFIDNWDPDWRAQVDGQPVAIEILFGTFKAVKLSKGVHRVVFSYQPF